MIYGSNSDDANNEIQVAQKIKAYASENNLALDGFIEDEQPNKIHWEKRELFTLINETLNPGDTLITYEACNLARSTLQTLEILDAAASRGIILEIVKYRKTFAPKDIVATHAFLDLVQNIDSDFVARRTTDALARRRAAGLPLGRPKGRKNKSRKLDKHKADIKKYLSLNISKASIAKLVGCHAQTLYNYLEDRNLMQDTDTAQDTNSIQDPE